MTRIIKYAPVMESRDLVSVSRLASRRILRVLVKMVDSLGVVYHGVYVSRLYLQEPERAKGS